eukprot:3133138-Prymnesium_polylepis.1
MIAAQQTNTAGARLLVAEGARLDARDVQGWTALHWGAQIGAVEMIEALLALGAPVACADGESSVLMVAAENQQLAAVER